MRSAVSRWKTLVMGLALVMGTAAMAAPAGLDNQKCLSCHDKGHDKITVDGGDGKKRDLRPQDSAKFAKSVHAKLDCVTCHTNISDAKSNHAHASNFGEQQPKCETCHEKLWLQAMSAGTTEEKSRLRVVVENIGFYKRSLHAKEDADRPGFPKAGCEDCHATHEFAVPKAGTPERKEWHLTIPATCGAKCHEEQLETYSGSVHGKEVLDQKNVKAAVCTDCHTTHGVAATGASKEKVAITSKCGNCHEESLKTYTATYHGQINRLGYAYTAKCFDCHGSHDVLRVDNPKSKMHPDNRLKTCRTCHSGKKDIPEAPEGFTSFQPHGHGSDFMKYPNIWLASKLMTQLLIGTFAFFWLHTLLWFYREWKERRGHREQPKGKEDRRLIEVPEHMRGKHFQRFTATWRIAHITFALSLMLLTLTGIPLFYAEAKWAAPLMSILGDPHQVGHIHRYAAVVFAGVFFWHLAYIGTKLVKDWNNFKIFGPNSLVPGPKDLMDILAMFRWFLGQAPRPKFDRWTYWEKFDYWAPFWGVTIIGVSGLMMWFPHITASILPGWVFNVTMIFHSEEAFLAVVFLFTVHFFNNHFRPDKFPLELVMFTGTMPLEEFKHDHALQYQRMLESGELDKYLVDAPSPTKVGASKVLGFVLIMIGLTLLTLVAIGFFTTSA